MNIHEVHMIASLAGTIILVFIILTLERIWTYTNDITRGRVKEFTGWLLVSAVSLVAAIAFDVNISYYIFLDRLTPWIYHMFIFFMFGFILFSTACFAHATVKFLNFSSLYGMAKKELHKRFTQG